MRDYGGYPVIELSFDANGAPLDPNAADDLHSFLATGAAKDATDLFFFSHGWNNTDDEAYDGLYGPFFDNLRDLIAAKAIAFDGRVPAVAAIFWPSKAFVFGSPPSQGQSAEDPVQALIGARLDAVAQMFPGDAKVAAAIDAARAAAPNLETDPAAADAFVAALAAVVPADPLVDEGLTQAFAVVATTPGRDVLAAIDAARAGAAAPVTPPDPSGMGGGASIGVAGAGSVPDGVAAAAGGGGAGLLDGLFSGVAASAADFLNLFTYYTMKARAGTVGTNGLAPLLAVARAARTIHLHLIGHSFGGRVVTAATSALVAPTTVNSISLLQAAYSHYGVAKDYDGSGTDGAFRSVIANRKATDFILATHSTHDSAVGTWYPVASQVMHQIGSAVAAVSKWGGMGGDGAQATPESCNDVLGATGTDYPPFTDGIWLRNIDGSGPDPLPTIHAHGDVTKPEIVSAITGHVVRYSK
jgi:hypothetical protein